MGIVKYVIDLLGFTQDNNQGSKEILVNATKRKRALEDEDSLYSDAGDPSFPSKNILHSQPPIKRAKMEDTEVEIVEEVKAKSPLRRGVDALKNLFFWKKKEEELAIMKTSSVLDHEATDINHQIETVDLIDDDDEDEKENTAPSDPGFSSTSSLSTLATFQGFSARSFSSPEDLVDLTTDLSSSRAVVKPTQGHVITTKKEKTRKAQAMSPEGVRASFKSGFQSRFDRFHTEKGIAKRVFHGGPEFKRPKPKSGEKKKSLMNAFQYCDQLMDKERYRALLNRFGVIKYPAITARKELLRAKSGSGSKPGPVVPSLDIISRVEDEADISAIAPQDLSLVTSTVIKSQTQEARERILSGLDITASPLLEKSHSRLAIAGASPFATPEAVKTRQHRVLGEDDKELSAAIEEVTSPKYLEKLHNKYGAVARERERQILRELERKGEAEKETEEVYSEIDKRLQTHLKITQAAVPDEAEKKDTEFDESQPTELPSLTPEIEAVIKKSQRSGGATVLIDAHKIQIRASDVQTLSGLNWLNDEIINFYMQMIVARSEGDKKEFRAVYAFSTFFYPRLMDVGFNAVKRWTKKVDLFSQSLILIPVHLGMHWCLATIDMDAKAIIYYDSMGGNNKAALKGLTSYLQQEHSAKKGSDLDLSEWKQIIAKKIPQQMNGSDCGMFTCKFAEYLSRRAKFTFGQSNMPYFRRRMVYEISKNDLLCP